MAPISNAQGVNRLRPKTKAQSGQYPEGLSDKTKWQPRPMEEKQL